MGNKIVSGFGGNAGSQEVPRYMAIAKQIGQPVQEYTGPVSANIMFNKMDLAFHGEDEGPVSHRPYLEFQGKVRSLSAVENTELPGGVRRVLFKEVNAPVVRGRWELSNTEIADLVEKGVFGGNSQVMPKGLRPVVDDPDNPFTEEKAVRSQLRVPSIFTEVQFDGVPIECVCQSMTVDVNGRDVPVFVATPVGRTAGQDGIVLTSAATGYGSMSQYFEPIEYYEHGVPDSHKDYVDVHDWLSYDDPEKSEDEQAVINAMAEKVSVARTVIRGPKVLTPVQDEEQRMLAAMQADIESNVKAEQIAGHGGKIDQALAYETMAADLAAKQPQAPQELQDAPKTDPDKQGGAQYVQPEELASEPSEDDTERLNREVSGEYASNPFSDEDDEQRRREAGADTGREQQELLTAEEKIQEAQKRSAQVSGEAVQQRDFGDE